MPERIDAALERIEGSAARVERLDLGVIISVSISVLTFAFGVGLYFGTILEQGRRIDALEQDNVVSRREMGQIKETLVKIDANVSFLAERASEDRRRLYD